MTIDTTKSSISRIYDYVLGGHHNFEVDRAAAQQILKVFPSYPRWARLNRWFLQMVAEQWAASDHRNILDLGSGMPTQGHFHTVAPQARVLYTDMDPMTVAYANEVLGDNPAVKYIMADVRQPDVVLEAADRLFGGERRVAIGCIGISYFLDDESLARIARTLHDWAAPGSVMALSFVYGEARNDNHQQTMELFKRSGSEIFPRTADDVRRLVAPWNVREIRSLGDWLGMEHLIEEADHEDGAAQMYGALLDY